MSDTIVHVLDTSSLVQMKDDLKPAKLWNGLTALRALVAAGVVTFPRQVLKELNSYGVPDTITSWCAAVVDERQQKDPSLDVVSAVMKNPTVAKVCDWNATAKADPADP